MKASQHEILTGSQSIVVYPEYDYKISPKKIESSLRTQAGDEYRYKWGDYDYVSFGLNYVPYSDYLLINQWANNNSEVVYKLTYDTGSTDVYSSMRINGDEPLDQYNKPYSDKRKGKIVLESFI